MELTDIKVDSRGVIYKYKIGSTKFLLVFTEKGALRAGETHNVMQHTFVAEGKVEVIVKENNMNVSYIIDGGMAIQIPRGVPHLFRFLEESITVESENEHMTTEYYPEYRKVVEKYLK